jgi:hypothetical protein
MGHPGQHQCQWCGCPCLCGWPFLCDGCEDCQHEEMYWDGWGDDPDDERVPGCNCFDCMD